MLGRENQHAGVSATPSHDLEFSLCFDATEKAGPNAQLTLLGAQREASNHHQLGGGLFRMVVRAVDQQTF